MDAATLGDGGSGAATIFHKESQSSFSTKQDELDSCNDDGGKGVDDVRKTSPEVRRIILKQDLHIMPLAIFLYFLCSLDRTNVGNAKVLNTHSGDSLLQSLGMSEYQYKVSLEIFYLALMGFEIPMGMGAKRFGASRWIALLCTGWGTMTMLCAATHDFASFTAVRFVLGAFEAGLFPSLICLLNFHYRPDEISFRAALIIASAALAGAFGGAIATGVSFMNGTAGLEAWKWLVILEGLPSILVAPVAWYCLPDWPEQSRFLSDREKALVRRRLDAVDGLPKQEERMTWSEAKKVLADWRAWLHYASFLGVSAPFSSISLFAPTIIQGMGKKGIEANLFTVPPYAVAWVFVVGMAWVADRYDKRGAVTTVCSLLAVASFGVLGGLPKQAGYNERYAVMMVAVPCAFASIPCNLGRVSANARGTTATVLEVALCVAVGNCGQMVGVWIYRSSEAPSFPTGMFTNLGSLLLTTVSAGLLTMYYNRCNRGLAPGRRWAT
ncbi:related to putative tartrate transporter [Pseudozyma flocculosa]|uniref:Related to putative tartrate transporter n=1 Tax=Pseudozyma flocculosa TaxID=84751 RepID=A0A5C3F8M5_9BASI|nr:related to putative tartrate transporter [Pseudozyma flocculosa]